MLGTTGSGFLLGERPIGSLDDYLAAGGGRGLEEAREIPIPKIVNLEDGEVTYDLRQAKKRPDWTYEDG